MYYLLQDSEISCNHITKVRTYLVIDRTYSLQVGLSFTYKSPCYPNLVLQKVSLK
jgi:hypothetical protein